MPDSAQQRSFLRQTQLQSQRNPFLNPGQVVYGYFMFSRGHAKACQLHYLSLIANMHALHGIGYPVASAVDAPTVGEVAPAVTQHDKSTAGVVDDPQEFRRKEKKNLKKSLKEVEKKKGEEAANGLGLVDGPVEKDIAGDLRGNENAYLSPPPEQGASVST